MEDCDLPENRDQSLGLYELLKKDIEDLGVSSPDWWHEAVETKETSNTFADKGDSDCTSEVCGCRSPVFKTPQVGLKSKRNRKSCDRLLALSRQRGSRVTSPDSDGSSEVDWYSPFKSSKLSPIPPLQMGGGAIPESLEPLLEEGSDMSWNSAFATPLASSVTFSGLTSSEKKVLMPHNSHRNPRVLFLGDESMDLASCSKTIDLGGEEMSQKAISDTAMLDENSFVDKTEFNMQDSVLSCKENILCCSTFRYKTNCNKTVDSPVTGTVGNLLEEKSSHSVTLSMDIIQKCDEAKDTETHFQGVKSDLVQYRVQEICSSGSGKERSQYNVLQRHSFIKSPDSGMNDFTENSAEIDFGNSSLLVSSISARVAVPRRLFHGNRRVGVHEEAPVPQHGVARAQIEDSGAVACDEISQGRSSGSVGTAKWSQYDSVVSNEVATSAVHSTEDFPQDLSINTLEEICQVTELLAADTDTPIEFSQNPDNTDNNKETPVCVQLSSPDKSCLCRTSTPIHCRNKHSKLDSGTRKKRIKFVHVNDSEKLNKRDENVRIVKENIQKQCEFEEWQHGGNSVLEQSVAVLDNNSVVDISSRVQTIKKTLNQNKKFTYVLSNIEMKATVTQDNGLNVLMEDVVKSAQAMENVVGTKVKHNNVRKFSAIASDRKGFIPFCKLDGLPRFVTKGESSEDFKITNGVTDTSYSMGEPILRSCNRSLSSNTGEACDQAISTGNLGNINKFIDVGGGTNAECKNICSAQCDSGTGAQEQSCILIKDARATRKFKQSSEAEEPCNTSDTRCDIQGDFSKQLHEFPSGSKNEMRYEFSRPNQTTEKFGFKNNTGNQIRLSNEALLKTMRLIDGIMIGEKVQVSPDMTFRVPGQDSKREELKDMKVSAVRSPYTDISCEQSNATPEYKSVMFDEAFRQGHILNKHNSSLICTRNINKQETVRRVQTEAHQNCNWNETATEENTLTSLEDKREGENMVTDLQIVLAAEDAELMQQLVEDGSMYSQWPSEVHSLEMEVCEKINNPATETKYHMCACGGKGNAEQKESCACSHVTREPQEDVSMSDGSNKSLFSKLTSLCPSGYENVEVSERNLQQTGQRHQNDIICDSTKKEGNESSIFNKVVQIMNISDNGSTNQIKKPHSGDVHVEEVLNTAGIRQSFSDNFDTSKIENRLQLLIDKSENNILTVDHSVLTTPGNRMQNVQPEMTECVASHHLRKETFPGKSDNNITTVTENMDTKLKTDFPVEHPGTTKLLRANRRNPSVSGTVVLNTEAEDERQKFEDIQVIDFASDTGNINLIKSNIGFGERGLLEKLGETDDSLQAPVTNTRNLFEAKNLTPLKFRNVNDCVKNVGKSDQDTTETPSCVLEKENHLQQLLRQRDGTVNVPEQVCVGNVEVPDENVTISSSRTAQNSGDLLQNAQSILNCDNNMAVDSITTVGGRKIVVSAKALRNAKHMFPEVDANIPSTLQITQCPALECPEAVGAALIHNVSNTQYSGHGTEYSELEGTKEEGFSVLQGLSAVSGKQISLSVGSLSRAKLMCSNKESQKGELVTESLEMKEMKQKESLFKEYKTASSVQISEPLNLPDFVISVVDTTMVEHKTERELEERERQALPVFQGFKTASGSEVFVSAKALNRAKLLFSEDEIDTKPTEDEIIASELNDPQKISSPVLRRFSVASKKGIGVSANTSNTMKLLFSEEGTGTESAEDATKASELEEEAERQYSPIFQGFSSASGKRVSVSAMALKSAKLMFSEEESCKELVANETSFPELQEQEEPHLSVLKGFSTASGKRVLVSAMALKNAKQMFSEEESCKKLVADEMSVPEVQEKKELHSPILKGFSTASGKRVSVSAMALKRAKQMFSEEESCKELVADETNVPELQEKEDPHSPFLKGFSTASGKRVSVSAMALKRARQMFSEEDSRKELVADKTGVSELQEKEKLHSPVLKGVLTASGKRVSVSAMALQRAKRMFSEEESCKELVADNTSVSKLKEKEGPHSPALKGFSTASGKRVSVSAMALKRARQMFSEEDSRKELVKDKTGVSELQEKEKLHSPVLKGFSTASGKRVSVSAMALNRAKQMFSEEESCKELVEDGTRVPKLKEKEELHSPVLKEFSAASGKRVSVSGVGLKRAKLMFLEEEMCKELVTDETRIPELKGNKEQHLQPEDKTAVSGSEDLQNQGSPVLEGFSTIGGGQDFVSAIGLNRDKVLFLEVATACTEIDALEGDHCYLNEKKEMVSHISQKLSPVFESCKSESAEFRNTEGQFISEEVYGTCKTKYLEFGKSSVDSETSPRQQIVPASKETPKKITLKLSRRVSGQERSVLQSEQISSSKPLFLNANQSKTEDCKQETSISEEVCHRVETFNGFTNMPNIKKKLHDCHHPIIQFDSCSTGSTGPKIVKDKERYDLGRGTPQHDDVTEDCNKTDGELVSLTQEVKESAAALLAHEAMFNSPAWIGSYVSCPDMLYDQCTGPPALVCSEVKDCSAVTAVDPGSPVLGSHDHFRKRRRVTMSADDSVHNLQTSNSSFKVPYKNAATSAADVFTPVQLYSGKRTARHLEFGTPFSKRLRTAELSKKASSQEPCRKKFILGETEVRPEVLAGRQAAAEEQAALVRSKMSAGNSRMRPCKGSYYVRKQKRHLQVKWKEAVEGARPDRYTHNQLLKFGLKESVINIAAVNAVEFRFSAWDHYSPSLCQENVTGILVGDGAHLVLDAKGTAGVEEVTRAFLSSPGIEVTLVPAGWVHNHYRWLVWKLASVERSFPQQFAARCLTPNMLLLQLKYRYDREIDHCHRSAIRKILECDDSPARRLVLCVARVIKLDSSEADLRYELELTDGWYGLTAIVDQELCQRIHHGTVAVGTKLISYGAELLNCEQGCSPLEVGGDVKLKLYSNSTRRARWDTKLGFHIHPGPLHISLTSILPGGGIVSSVSVTVVRVYPLLYVEKLDEGKSVSRSVWAEERVAAQWERKHQAYVEQVYSQLKVELHQDDSKQRHLKSHYHIPSAQDLALICSGDKLCEILELAPDPASVEALLNEEQKVAVADYQRSKHESVQRELEAKVREKLKETATASRNVTPLFKVRCVDPAVPMSSRSAVLSVWRPSEDVMQLLKEGITVTLFNISAAGVRNGDLKLSAGRQTIYRPSSLHNCDFHERRVTSFSEVTRTDFRPPFGELDVVGMVAYIGSALQENSGFQTVYLADTDFNILGLVFWGGVKQFGWDEVLKPRALVSASNLQWRHGAAVRWVPCAYVSELSSFSLNPCQPHLQQALATLRQEVGQQDFGAFASACEDKVSTLLRGCTSPLPRMVSRRIISTSSDTPQTGVKQGGIRPPLSRSPINSPKTVSPQVACAKGRMPLLSSPSQVPHVGVTYSSDVVTNGVQTERRLHKLQLYGEPPPLSPQLMMPIKPTLRKEFHVPLRKESPVSSTDSSPLNLKHDPG